MANIGIGKERGDNATDREPFKVHWLDSAYQQTLLPNAPWHLVRHLLGVCISYRLCK
jgi:hypothetical protein